MFHKLLFKTATMTFKDLFTVNQNSVNKKYNKNFYEDSLFEVVKKENAMSTNEALALKATIYFLMFHEHRGGVPCEQHIRTQVQYTTEKHVYLDMTISDFEQYAMPVEHPLNKECA
jgi:hypothetical protein